MIHINVLGIGMCAIAFGAAFAVGKYFGFAGEDQLMMIAGPIAAVSDLLYRARSKEGHWLHPNKGGALFFMPVWCFGIIWLAIGAIRPLM
jgi:hypothetical protein